jgi:hypothetical protein
VCQRLVAVDAKPYAVAKAQLVRSICIAVTNVGVGTLFKSSDDGIVDEVVYLVEIWQAAAELASY